jgi:hypothetical protein
MSDVHDSHTRDGDLGAQRDHYLRELEFARARERVLRDALQAALPYLDRLRVTLQQQAVDLGNLRASLTRATLILRNGDHP